MGGFGYKKFQCITQHSVVYKGFGIEGMKSNESWLVLFWSETCLKYVTTINERTESVNYACFFQILTNK